MKVRICWRTKVNKEQSKKSVSKNKFSMKEAKHKVKPLVADENILDVWVEHFGGWHWYCHKRYKKDGEVIKQDN